MYKRFHIQYSVEATVSLYIACSVYNRYGQGIVTLYTC